MSSYTVRSYMLHSIIIKFTSLGIGGYTIDSISSEYAGYTIHKRLSLYEVVSRGQTLFLDALKNPLARVKKKGLATRDYEFISVIG